MSGRWSRYDTVMLVMVVAVLAFLAGAVARNIAFAEECTAAGGVPIERRCVDLDEVDLRSLS